MRIELTKLILVGTRITYQATGDASRLQQFHDHCVLLTANVLLVCFKFVRTKYLLAWTVGLFQVFTYEVPARMEHGAIGRKLKNNLSDSWSREVQLLVCCQMRKGHVET